MYCAAQAVLAICRNFLGEALERYERERERQRESEREREKTVLDGFTHKGHGMVKTCLAQVVFKFKCLGDLKDSLSSFKFLW